MCADSCETEDHTGYVKKFQQPEPPEETPMKSAKLLTGISRWLKEEKVYNICSKRLRRIKISETKKEREDCE